MNSFVWKMALRELRGAGHRFFFFLFCIAIGVGSLVGVDNVSSNIEKTLLGEARNLLAADLEIRTHQPLSEKQLKEIQSIATGIHIGRVTELTAMSLNPQNGISQLVELKAVDSSYPFYGRLETDPPLKFLPGELSLPHNALWVQKPFLSRLDLSPGDEVKIGQNLFTVWGVLLKEPDRVAGTFSFGPRVLMTQEGLAQTELIQPGSRVHYRFRVKIPSFLELEQAKDQIKVILSEGQTVRTYRETQPSIARFIKRLGIYLGMIGLITLMVGGIGVANGIRVFLKQKVDTIAILKCLGGTSNLTLRIYLFQVVMLGFVGSLFGILIGYGISEFLKSILETVMETELSFTLLPSSAFRGMGMGLLTTILFTLWPLLGVQKITPLKLFRREIEEQKNPSMGWVGWVSVSFFLMGLAILAIWQAGSVKLGILLFSTLVVCFFILRLASWGLLSLICTAPRPDSIPIRYGLSNLSRPGNQTHTIIFSIGLGVTIILAIYFVQFSLMNEIRENLPSDAPSLFFIDIQRDQKQGVESILSQETSITASELTPIVRSRIHSINGTSVEQFKKDPSSSWYYSREYVLTLQRDLPRHNTIEKGKWWSTKDFTEPALISVEKEAAEGLNIDIGSKIVFDIQGVHVPATVSSIREVDWGSMTTNFYIIFSPGSLEGVPLNYIATARLPQAGEMALQDKIVQNFPNITAINLRDILDTVSVMLNRMGQVIRFMAVFSVLAGLVVLSSSISATRLQRIRETVIYKTLGATRPMLLQGFAVEFAMVGMIAGIIGVTLSTLVGWITVHFILEMKWHFSAWGFFWGIFLTMVLTLLTGIFSSYRILGQKPLPILMEE